MHCKAWLQGLSCLATCLLCLPVQAQSTTAQSPAFEAASIKPAAAGAQTGGLAFMVPLARQASPRGLLTMTAPLAPFIMFAYDIQDEVEARAFRARLPEWAQEQKYTIVARPPQEASTIDQIRLMLRNLLEDRFALKAHRESQRGAVNILVVARPGVIGPGMKPHAAVPACLEHESVEPPRSPETGKPAPVYCGQDLHTAPSGIFHVSLIDVTLAEASTLFGGLGGVLGGRTMEPVIDGTGLSGKWDITLDFQPERDGLSSDHLQPGGEPTGPTFTGALEKQLGLRLKKGSGEVEQLIIDHITPPTLD